MVCSVAKCLHLVYGTRVVGKYQLSAGGLCGKRRSKFDAQRMHTPPTIDTSREVLGPVKTCVA